MSKPHVVFLPRQSAVSRRKRGGGGRRKMVHSWPLVNMTGGGGVWALGIAFVSWDIWFERIGGLWKTLSSLAVGVWSTKRTAKPLNNGKREGGQLFKYEYPQKITWLWLRDIRCNAMLEVLTRCQVSVGGIKINMFWCNTVFYCWDFQER